MSLKKYGSAPQVTIPCDLSLGEYCYSMYLPIKMPFTGVRVPSNLKWLKPLVNRVMILEAVEDKHIYLTVKHMYVEGTQGNRPGWHSDGFMSEDINYIWYDSSPTEFCIQGFNLSQDHQLSLQEMEEQGDINNIVTYPCKTLLRLDQYVIHRTAIAPPGVRAFVKISISKDRYNLAGNAHNCLFNYDWDMHPRASYRNHPVAQ